ncbi:MAG: nucleoside monophosphate kinase, partial [Elainellaceae cyanobacterium]
MKLIILGGPGAGKGTQASQLCQFLSIPHISTGTILREAIAAHSDLGKQVQSYVAQGEFVPDKIMIELIRQRLQQPDSQQGWLLDGYPLTAFQAEELDFLLDSL